MSQGIYKITNKINNKCYIGKSTNIEFRWKYHIKNRNSIVEYNKPLYYIELLENMALKIFLLRLQKNQKIILYQMKEKNIGFNIMNVMEIIKDIMQLSEEMAVLLVKILEVNLVNSQMKMLYI